MSCIHQQCCTEREGVLPIISHSPLTIIAQSDSKISCRYHYQVDYELCAYDVLLSSFKTEIVSTSIYSIIFNIADERLNLGKFDFNI